MWLSCRAHGPAMPGVAINKEPSAPATINAAHANPLWAGSPAMQSPRASNPRHNHNIAVMLRKGTGRSQCSFFVLDFDPFDVL
jgi:hypothetical protein